MRQKTPGRIARHRGEIEAGKHNLVPPSQDFNRLTGPRLLRDVMTQDWRHSVIPEEGAADLRFSRPGADEFVQLLAGIDGGKK